MAKQLSIAILLFLSGVQGNLIAGWVNETVRTIRPGDVLVIPPRTPHSMWNPSTEEARVLWRTEPALKTEQFFESIRN